eukprot:70834-Chlamydomonas_euryale.AAC.1
MATAYVDLERGPGRALLASPAHLLDLLSRGASEAGRSAALAAVSKYLDEVVLAHQQRIEPRLFILQFR